MARCMRTLGAFVLALCALLPAATAALEVNGNVYTSPTFDYQIQWSDPWFFVEELAEAGADTLILTDGPSQALFSFTFVPSVTAPELLDAVLANVDVGVTNVQPMLDAQGAPLEGGDDTRAWTVISATQQLPDGTSVDFVQYFDVRTLAGGVVLLMTANTASYFYDESFVQGWMELADTALVGAAPGPPVATAAPTTVPAAPTASAPTAPAAPTEAPATLKPTMIPAAAGAGEPAPAFAAGPWRIAVRAVDLGETIDYLSLGLVEGNQWVVVYADVTNWSAEEATLDVAGMTLATAGGPIAPDLAGTQSTATLLGLEPANGSSVTVAPGGATRLALAYSVPLSESELILELDGTQLPLQDAVGQQLDVTDLSTIATPPAVQTGVLSTTFGGPDFMTLQVDTGAGPVTIQLAGADFPTDAACFDSALAMMSVTGLDGSTVRLETDPSVSEPETYYVWIENPLGHWELLNQTLIVKGVAIEGDVPEAARFGAWLEQTDSVAEANGVGLWSACAGQL
jgi:hypothetical protein